MYKCPSGASSWIPLTKAGALLFLRDSRKKELAYLRLVDVDENGEADDGTGKIPIWEHELFAAFGLRKDAPYFYSFESDVCQYGFLFCDVKEAAEFAKCVEKKAAKIGKGMSLPDHSDTVSVSSMGSSRSRRTSFLGSLFGSSSKDSIDSHQQEPKKKSKAKASKLDKVCEDDIGDPINFQHLSHIGFNPSSGIWDVQNIPPKWKRFFEAAGVGKEQLESRENAAFIAEFVQTVQQEEAAAKKKKGPPPPPPPKKKAPAPPPSRQAPSVAAKQPPSPVKASPVKPSQPVQPPKAPPPLAAKAPASGAPPPPPPSFAQFKAFQQEQHHTPQEEDEEAAPSAPKRPTPQAPASSGISDELLKSIRAATLSDLRPTPVNEPSSPAPEDNVPGDAMAALLAKQMKARKQANIGSESEDDEEW